MPQTQKQTVKQSVQVIVGSMPHRKRRTNLPVMRQNMYQRLTQQNLRESYRRDNVGAAMSKIGGYEKLRDMKLPYETLEASVSRPRHTISFNTPEPERVAAKGPPQTAMPIKEQTTARPFLKSQIRPNSPLMLKKQVIRSLTIRVR